MPMRQLYISLPPLAPLLDTQKQSRLSFYRLPPRACHALFQRLLLNRHTSCTAFSRLARVLCMPTLNSDLTLPHSLARYRVSLQVPRRTSTATISATAAAMHLVPQKRHIKRTQPSNPPTDPSNLPGRPTHIATRLRDGSDGWMGGRRKRTNLQRRVELS